MEQLVTTILDNAVDVLSAALLSLLVACIGALTRWIHVKYNVLLSNNTQSMLRALAQDAVDAAEEFGHKAVKELVTGVPNAKKLTSEEKFAYAVNVLCMLAKKHNLSRDRAETLILSALGETRKYQKQ